jgi:alpha-glucoside transport system permease protein
MAVSAKAVTGTGSRSRFWRAPMLESLPLRISVLVICFLWTLPTAGLLVTSFRNPQLITKTGWWEGLLNALQPDQWTLQNYANVLGGDNMGTAFLNSLIVTIPSTVIPITIAAFAAYAFAWIPFPGRGPLFIVVVALLVVPLQMALIPILKIYSGASLYGTFLGIWLAHTGFGLPLAVYLLRNYIGALPSEIIESARMDGADHFTIFWRLIIPLSVPALAAFAIFQFLWVWNDLLVALVFLGGTPENRVLTVALQQLVGARGENWELLTAAAFISMSLPLVVFFALQRYFVRGLTAGSVKG